MNQMQVLGRLAAITLVCSSSALAAGISAAGEGAQPATTGKTATTATATKAATNPAQDAAMAEMMKYAMPGKPHAQLKAMEGTWKAVVKSWSSPGEPTTSEGTMTNRMILGGRYLEGQFRGKFFDQPFEGISLTGYDMKKNELISLWLDSMSTTWMTQNGTLSTDGKEMTARGMADGPTGQPTQYKSVTRIVDPNKHVYTMSSMTDGKETPVMEITYTRQGTTLSGQ